MRRPKTSDNFRRLELVGIFFVLLSVALPSCSCFAPRRPPSLNLDQRRKQLLSSLDDDPELVDEEYSFAPTTERANYLTEAEEFQQANELLSSSTSNQTTVDLETELSNSFLQYAYSIILGRAIPDARDGLKPVHRRILYSMSQLGLSGSSGYRKCARVVGEVLGKFHPHGDLAVYDALVRLAQDFNTNYPLIDGHGNFGSIDADPAAAMRYTECQLTKLSAQTLLQDLQTVEFVPNFDGNEQEPTVLPSKLPILLLNGASGIAVGMATNIPPHNLREICSALIALTQARVGAGKKQVTNAQLFRLVPGPDFPTGATILGSDGAKQLYTTGQGGVVQRATTRVEQVSVGKRTTRNAIVVTQLPYQVNKAALLEKIAMLVNDKKLEGLADLRDESDRDGIRVVLELKRDAVPQVVLNNVYKKTALQQSFSGNLLALMPNEQGTGLVPQRFTLRQALECFLDFRFDTIRKKAEYELAQVQARMNIVQGLLLALEQVDAVIDAVRKAADTAAARQAIQALLETNEDQTEAILRLQLSQLTRLNKGKLTDERKSLQATSKTLTNLLKVDTAVYDVMVDEFTQLSKQFGRDRQSKIIVDVENSDGDISELDLIRNSRSVIVVLRSGYIKRMPLKTFESQGRATRGKRGTTATAADDVTQDDNDVLHCFTCNDHDILLMVTQTGTAHGIRAYQVPSASRTAKGHAIPSVLNIKPSDTITGVLPIADLESDDDSLVLATRQGWIKRTALSDLQTIPNRKLGLNVIKLEPGDALIGCQLCQHSDSILMGSTLGLATRFEVEAGLRPTGRTSRGVRAMRLKPNDSVASMNVLSTAKVDKEHVLVVTSNGFGKRVPTSEFKARARGGVGIIAMKFKQQLGRDDQVQCLLAVGPKDEILIITAKGIMLRQKVADISVQGRTATGVKMIRLDPGDEITSVSIVPNSKVKITAAGS